MKLTELNQSNVKFVMISESLIKEQDELFIESIIDEGLKDIAKKALKSGKNIMANMAARGVIMAPKVAKFFNSPYGRIALALAVNAVAIGVAPGAVDDTLSSMGGDYDMAMDAMQDLVSNNDQLPDSLVSNLQSDGNIGGMDIGNIDVGDIDVGGDIDMGDVSGNEDGGSGGDVTLGGGEGNELSLTQQSTTIKNLLRAASNTGNSSGAAAADRLDRVIDSLVNAEPENFKEAANKGYSYLSSHYNLEEHGLEEKITDLFVGILRAKKAAK